MNSSRNNQSFVDGGSAKKVINAHISLCVATETPSDEEEDTCEKGIQILKPVVKFYPLVIPKL